MKSSGTTLDKRLDKIDATLERMSLAMVKGFDETDKKIETVRSELKNSIDIYARAVDAYAKTAETYMQEMLALGTKVDRLERQIEQIATYLKLKLAD